MQSLLERPREWPKVFRSRMVPKIQVGGILDRQDGGVLPHAVHRAALLDCPDRSWGDALVIPKAVDGLGRGPGASGLWDARRWLRCEGGDDLTKALIEAVVAEVGVAHFLRDPGVQRRLIGVIHLMSNHSRGSVPTLL